MRSRIKFVIFLIFASKATYGFELATHGKLTFDAYTNSVLSDEEFLRSFGLNTKNSLSSKYYLDVSNVAAMARAAPDKVFSAEIIQKKLGFENDRFTIAGWLKGRPCLDVSKSRNSP